MRVDVASQRGPVAMIMDYQNHQMIMLMSSMQMFMKRPLPAAQQAPQQSSGQGQGQLTDTGTTETILGYPCKKYTFTGPKDSASIWVTDQLGFWGGIPSGGPGGQGQQPPKAWEGMLKGKGFFPMRVEGANFKLEVTSVDKGALPEGTFEVPSGYKDMAGMMGGFMPPGGGRPSYGGNN